MSVEKAFHCYNGHALALIAGGSNRLRGWAFGRHGINVYLVAAGISTPVAKLFALQRRSTIVDILCPGRAGTLPVVVGRLPNTTSSSSCRRLQANSVRSITSRKRCS